MNHDFETEIKLLEGKIKWNVIYFPHSAEEVFGTKGRVPVTITVDGHEFEHTLLPSRNGHYLVYNKMISQKVKKNRGDLVRVSLKKFEGKRELVIPENIQAGLEKAKVLDAFMKQPDYFKREQINHILSAKKEETRTARLEKMISRLQDQK